MRLDSTPLVSVIIPCYNCEELVEVAINSVLAQSYQNIELLLVNNNSTDATLATLQQFEAQYPRKIKVYSETKRGACAARNHGLRHAAGEWIQFLDADDELLPSKIEKQVALVAQHHPDLVVGDYRKIRSYTPDGRATRTIVEEVVADDDPWMGLINSRLGITSANLWRKEVLFRVNGWNEEFSSSQEYDLLFRLLKTNAHLVADHQVLTVVHAQLESVSRTKDHTKLYTQYLNRYNLRCSIYQYLHGHNLLNREYRKSLSLYLYFHLLLIGELNIDHFKEEVKQHDFRAISLADKLGLLKDLLRNSAKRRYGHANLVLKLLEWQYYFVKNLKLLLYEESYRYRANLKLMF